MSKAYNDLIEHVKEIYNLKAAEEMLQWDQETYMPPRGVEDRSLQLASLSALIHEKLTSGRVSDLLQELRSEKAQEKLTPEQGANVREIAWEFHRASALPTELVKELAKTKSLGIQNWTKAKEKSDFSIFSPYLSKLVELKKREAEAIGYEDQPYDALLDEFEPGLKTARVVDLFSRLRNKLIPVVSKVIDSGIRPEVSFLTSEFPVEQQKKFNIKIAEQIGYDLERGRMDETMHPFTCGSLHDTRITTRYHPKNMRFSLFATIHETGHALYEQGYLDKHYGTPMGQPVSYGIHESQSRMWENLVGRSLPFWKYYYPKLREFFPKQLKGRSVRDFYAAINDVHPSLIRVEADEATYNLHILLRFEMENALFTDTLETEEAPQVWNEKMDKFLKIEVPDDAHGVLQDVHWSHGYFGYFPTYTLGNLFAAQFFEQVKKDIPDLEVTFENGEFHFLLEWLRRNIHEKGRLYRANELVKKLTGKPLDEEIFIRYLTVKFGDLYDF